MISNTIATVSKIAKSNKRARKLYTGSAFTMATWGHQGSGIPNSELLGLERDAISGTGISSAGRCRTIGLLVAYGLLGTPRATIVRETIRSWFEIVRIASAVPQVINNIRYDWGEAKHKLCNSNFNIENLKES